MKALANKTGRAVAGLRIQVYREVAGRPESPTRCRPPWTLSCHSHLMQIVRAKPGDAATLTAIAFAAKRHWGYPERWIESWRDALTAQPDFLTTDETYSTVVENRTVGFYAFARKGDRLDLQHLWVLPDAMGQGVGRLLFAHAVDRVRD